jgi:Tol biopolymer transport system component/DNA-binding winged helix-turn-helix (wHTH) protein
VRLSKTVRFGVFEADLQTGEMRKHGVRLRLQEQSFRILAALLELPGELVTRDQLIQSLWPDGRVVDYDRGLNAAMTRLRQVLLDSADQPKYIETVAGRGYRFIAPVEAAANGHLLPRPETIPTSPPKSRVPVWAALGIVFAATLAWALWVARRPPARVSIRPNTMVRLTSDSGLTTTPALSPDGTLLAYASDRSGEGNLDIWIQQTGGGDPVRLTFGKTDNEAPVFSPDGRKIAFHSKRDGGGIDVIPALGGEPVRLATGGDRPRFSPDGKWLAYSVGSTLSAGNSGFFQTPGASRIFVIPATGGAARELCTDFASSAFPLWTPDGNHILFLGNRDPQLWTEPVGPLPGDLKLDWWVRPLQGGAAIPTGTARAVKEAGFTGLSQVPQLWLPDEDGVLFSGPVGDTRNLWVMPISRATWKVSQPYRLTSGTTRETYPSIAGGKLVFASVNEAVDVWAVPVDANKGMPAGASERLTEDAALHTYPAVSPDGKLVAFSSNRAGNRDVWLKELTGQRKETQLTNAPTPEFYPSFSPDGSKLIYRAMEDRKPVYYIRSLSDGSLTRVCEGCSEVAGWSSDASRLLCVRCSNVRIGLLDLASGERRDITDSSTFTLWNARFSPDDRWISFNASSQAHSRIFVARFPTGVPVPESQWIPITTEDWADNPRWSPDGNSLYYFSDRDGFRCIWVQRLDVVSRKPLGPPTVVFHSHQTRRSLGNVSIGNLELSVARDKVVFDMAELSGNIWMARLTSSR